MKKTKNKTLTTIALVLILTVTALNTAFQSVKAETITPNAFLAVSPNPVGVNQDVVVIVWLAPIMQLATDRFHNFEVLITKPDGNTQMLGPYTSSSMGGAVISYTPTVTGNYIFKFRYSGETFSSTGDVFNAAESPTTTLVVQQEPIEQWPEIELPTDYWERPISAENREWSQIAGNWLQYNYNSTNRGYSDSVGAFNPYTQAPRSAHIVWTKELGLGGLVGGSQGSYGYYTGQSYLNHLAPPIIMNGMLYYYKHQSLWGEQPRYMGLVCVNLRTGEVIWQKDEIIADIGQLYFMNMPAGQGVIPYLWDVYGSTWDVYEPFTGDWLFSFENAMTCNRYSPFFGDDGTFYYYLLNGQNNWLAMWNQTKAFVENGLFYISSEGNYRPYGFKPTVYDWRKGIEWNVTIPERRAIGSATDPSATVYPVLESIYGNILLATVTDGSNTVYYHIGYDRTTGKELWVRDDRVQGRLKVPGEGIYAAFSFITRTWTAYDINTGDYLWESDPNEYPWGSYINYAPTFAYGKLYSGSWDGYLHAFDAKTGKEVWKFSTGTTTETIFNTWPVWNGPIIGGGVAFISSGEETPTQPLTRGNRVFAVDAETGDEIWNISGLMSLRALADGYLVGYNAYDYKAYCFGKGPSETTVTISSKIGSKGSPVLIEGTVTDQSSGQTGTPCVSKESMSTWMEYLHMQKPCPMDVTGVPVKLEAFGADGSYIDIGTVMSDVNGFRRAWTPTDEGTYTIMATFYGDDSYGSSWGATALFVGQEAAPSGPITPEEPTGFITTEVAIIAAVAVAVVIGIASYWALRRRK